MQLLKNVVEIDKTNEVFILLLGKKAFKQVKVYGINKTILTTISPFILPFKNKEKDEIIL